MAHHNTMDEPEDPEDLTPEQLVCVGSYASEPCAHEHALVILAMGQPCWVNRDLPNQQFVLFALPDHSSAIQDELAAYHHEQHHHASGPQPIHDPAPYPAGWGLYFSWAATLVSIHLLQKQLPWLKEAAASSSLALIDQHQWWRPLTGLFLHADGSHLLGNLLSGLFFAILVSKSIGSLKGWAMIISCGTLGNLITSLCTYPEPFVSIGASTAVFGALGILSGHGLTLMLNHRLHLPWLRIMSPVIAGIIVLGMIGSGQPGGNTDVLGHVFGFLSGITAGFIHGQLHKLKHTSNA